MDSKALTDAEIDRLIADLDGGPFDLLTSDESISAIRSLAEEVKRSRARIICCEGGYFGEPHAAMAQTQEKPK